MTKVVIAEKVSPATLAVFQKEPGITVLTAEQLPSAEAGGLAAAITDADALIVRSAVQVTDALLAHAKQLRVIGRAGVGVDNIDSDAATRRGVVVMNTPGANAIAVAELTVATMLALARQLPKANAALHDGRWEKKSLEGRELRGKTLGIIGLGRIGLEVARRARSFGMELVAYDPFVAALVARENNVRLASMDEVFAAADYLTLHVGLTPQTDGLVNAASIAKMKRGVRIVNCARGELIMDNDLAAALRSGHVAGAALDVFRKEPLKESPFFGMENVILTPHIAGSTRESQEAVGVQIAEQVRDYLKLGIAQNAVNMASLTEEEYAVLAPQMNMAERLGSFLAQVTDGSVEGIALHYHGRLATLKTELIRNSAIAGVLGGSESVNRVNAATVAAQRGIRVFEEKREEGEGRLHITLHTRTGERNASGTVVRGSAARLLNAHGVDVEAPLYGQLLCIRNQDVPGVIGRVGTLLGAHGINIASFALGRPAPETDGANPTAFAVIAVEGVMASSLLEELRAQDAIASARLVSLPPIE